MFVTRIGNNTDDRAYTLLLSALLPSLLLMLVTLLVYLSVAMTFVAPGQAVSATNQLIAIVEISADTDNDNRTTIPVDPDNDNNDCDNADDDDDLLSSRDFILCAPAV